MLLPVEQVELALLTMTLESSQQKASFGVPIELVREVIRRTGLAIPEHQVLAVTLDTYDRGLIRIGRYVGTTPTPMNRARGDEYFYDGDFYINPQPSAYRRQQELQRENRLGIFISHISEEKPIALKLQAFLEACFPEIPVFVSSDRTSIESGDKWFQSILKGLSTSNVVIVLLSKASLERRWINFEAGFGMGQHSRVIPFVCRELDKNDIGLPLSQLQARDLRDKDDVKALVDTAARECHQTPKENSIPELLANIAKAGSEIPSADLQVSVYRQNSSVNLSIRNNGNRPLEMVDAELLLPKSLCTASLGDIARPVRERIYGEVKGVPMIGYRLTTLTSPIAHLDVDPLRTYLDSASGEVILNHLALPINKPLDDGDMTLPVQFRVCSKLGSVANILTIADLPVR